MGINERYRTCEYNDYHMEILGEVYFSKNEAYAFEWLLVNEHKQKNLAFIFPEDTQFNGRTECFKELHRPIMEELDIMT